MEPRVERASAEQDRVAEAGSVCGSLFVCCCLLGWAAKPSVLRRHLLWGQGWELLGLA